MKYWVLAEVPYTGTDGPASADEVSAHMIRDVSVPLVEPKVGVDYPDEKGVSEVTFEIEAKTPLLALAHSLNMLHVALAQSGESDHWDMQRAVVRVAPADEAMYMYRVTEPVKLPGNYQGPMQVSDPNE